ncbi:MAG: hypothetical protein HYR93_00430 [Chloroflexi bacterium]|nr:hypothetical protein [Chloroflexota bacterium]
MASISAIAPAQVGRSRRVPHHHGSSQAFYEKTIYTIYWTFDQADKDDWAAPGLEAESDLPIGLLPDDLGRAMTITDLDGMIVQKTVKNKFLYRMLKEGSSRLYIDPDQMNSDTPTGDYWVLNLVDDTQFTWERVPKSQAEIEAFHLTGQVPCPWGKYSDGNTVEGPLVPWKTAAVTSGKARYDRRVVIPFFDGMMVYDPVSNTNVKLNGVFDGVDSSYSFTDYEGWENWVDIFVGTYKNYKHLSDVMDLSSIAWKNGWGANPWSPTVPLNWAPGNSEGHPAHTHADDFSTVNAWVNVNGTFWASTFQYIKDDIVYDYQEDPTNVEQSAYGAEVHYIALDSPPMGVRPKDAPNSWMRLTRLAVVNGFSTSPAPAGWKTRHFYSAGEKASYRGRTYCCIQSHTSQADWKPDLVPALWSAGPEPVTSLTWGPGIRYIAGDQACDVDGFLYRCLQSHTSRPNWAPYEATALWKRVK